MVGKQRLVKGLVITSLWIEAGWKTAEVDMDTESLVFVKLNGPEDVPGFNLDDAWPAISVGEWPEGLSLRREDMTRTGSRQASMFVDTNVLVFSRIVESPDHETAG